MDRNVLLKIYNDCKYIDLDSESSNAMLTKCTHSVINNIQNVTQEIIEPFVEGGGGGLLNQKDSIVIEAFSNKEGCCPQGQDIVDGVCKKVCINCKYNNCDHSSRNIGQIFDYIKEDKPVKNDKVDNDVFQYIITDIDTTVDN